MTEALETLPAKLVGLTIAGMDVGSHGLMGLTFTDGTEARFHRATFVSLTTYENKRAALIKKVEAAQQELDALDKRKADQMRRQEERGVR